MPFFGIKLPTLFQTVYFVHYFCFLDKKAVFILFRFQIYASALSRSEKSSFLRLKRFSNTIQTRARAVPLSGTRNEYFYIYFVFFSILFGEYVLNDNLIFNFVSNAFQTRSKRGSNNVVVFSRFLLRWARESTTSRHGSKLSSSLKTQVFLSCLRSLKKLKV